MAPPNTQTVTDLFVCPILQQCCTKIFLLGDYPNGQYIQRNIGNNWGVKFYIDGVAVTGIVQFTDINNEGEINNLIFADPTYQLWWASNPLKSIVVSNWVDGVVGIEFEICTESSPPALTPPLIAKGELYVVGEGNQLLETIEAPFTCNVIPTPPVNSCCSSVSLEGDSQIITLVPQFAPPVSDGVDWFIKYFIDAVPITGLIAILNTMTQTEVQNKINADLTYIAWKALNVARSITVTQWIQGEVGLVVSICQESSPVPINATGELYFLPI